MKKSRKLKRAIEIYSADGLGKLLHKCSPFIKNYIKFRTEYVKLRRKYGTTAPKPSRVLYVDPTEISYTIGTEFIPDTAPIYGVLDGRWDLHRKHVSDHHTHRGMKERFVDEKEWDETQYYRKNVENLRETGKIASRLDTQTIPCFESYLSWLDELYEDIKQDGYNQSSIVCLDIARDGEWLIHHGNHRIAIANILDVDAIPAIIRYRHQNWQNIRIQAVESPKSIKPEYTTHEDLISLCD